MKTVLLIGIGRFGKYIALQMNQLGHEIMAVDKNEEVINEILPYVTNAQIGDSANIDFLKSLGIRNFDICIVAIGKNFQSSLETTSNLKDLGARLVVSRASSDVHAKFLLRNGADDVVYPEKQVAEWAATKYSSDHIFDYFSMGDGYAVMEVEVPDSWVGKSVGTIGIRNRYHVNIVAARTDGRLNMQIASNTIFTGKERLLILGRDEDIQKCFRG